MYEKKPNKDRKHSAFSARSGDLTSLELRQGQKTQREGHTFQHTIDDHVCKTNQQNQIATWEILNMSQTNMKTIAISKLHGGKTWWHLFIHLRRLNSL